MTALSPEHEPQNQHGETAEIIVLQRLDWLTKEFGTAEAAGQNELWLPFHAVDPTRHIDRLANLYALQEDFTVLPEQYQNVPEQDFQKNDLDVIAMTLSHFYPDMRDLNSSAINFTVSALGSIGKASDRNIALAETIRCALCVKKDQDGRLYQPINNESPFILQQLLAGDALMSCMADETSPTDMVSLALEQLLKDKKIVYNGRQPCNLAEVCVAAIDQKFLADHLAIIYGRWYGAPRNFHLPTTSLHFDKYELVEPVAAEIVSAASSSSFETLLEIARKATHQQIDAPPVTMRE